MFWLFWLDYLLVFWEVVFLWKQNKYPPKKETNYSLLELCPQKEEYKGNINIRNIIVEGNRRYPLVRYLFFLKRLKYPFQHSVVSGQA
jgi:hypothetical protein